MKSLLEFKNKLVHSRGNDRIKPGGRLIKKKNLGIHGQRASHGGALLHATAQLRGHVVFESGQTHLVEFEAQNNFDGRIFQLGMLAQRQGHVFSDRHRTKQCATLERHADFFPDFVHLRG